MVLVIRGTHGSIHYYKSAFDKGFEELVFVGGRLTSIHHEVSRQNVASDMRIAKAIGAKVELFKDFT